MKVYDWKTLIFTVTLGFGLILLKLIELFNGGGLMELSEVFLFSYASYKGLKSALNEEQYLKDKENQRRAKIVNQRLFGRFSLLVYSGYLILLILSLVVIIIWPQRFRLAGWLFILAIVYAAVLIVITYSEDEKLKAEEKAEKEQQNISE